MALLLIPLRDDGLPGPRAIATPALMAVCTGVFLRLQLLPAERARAPSSSAPGWYRPSFWGTLLPTPALAEPLPVPAPVTSLFVHAGWLHLLANLAYLWLFGLEAFRWRSARRASSSCSSSRVPPPRSPRPACPPPRICR